MPGEDYCFLEKFERSCPRGMVVHVLSAKLGRMEKNKCINSAEFLGCFDDISAHIRERCYRKEKCEIFVSTLGEMIQSCPRSLMPYLRIDYECRTGILT